jgi:hypothetical protein
VPELARSESKTWTVQTATPADLEERKKMSKFTDQFRDALRVSTPLVAIRTPDPAATIRGVIASLPEDFLLETPFLLWDAVHGIVGINDQGKNIAKGIASKPSQNPLAALRLAEQFPEKCILFFSNAHRFWSDAINMQGIWNLRDQFKANSSLLGLLTTQGAILPVELADDVIVLDEPLPSVEEMNGIVHGLFEQNEAVTGTPVAKVPKETLTRASDALIGLAAFPAEQRLAMSLSSKGLDLTGLWEGKRQVIEQTEGLKVWRGLEDFDSLGGLHALKAYARLVLKGRWRIRVVLFLDEIEKHFAGSGTDLSGTTTEMAGTFLTWSQNIKARGVLLLGHAGTGKSAIAKALANEAGVLTIAMDFSGMKGSLVGQSNATLRKALKVIEAIAGDGIFLVATCNKIDALSPELRRRFKRGTFFVDLPNEEERAAIWAIYRAKHNIPADEKEPYSVDWTGAEIETCCESADELGISLRDAGRYIVPVAQSAPDSIEALRTLAHDKFLSATTEGTYQKGSTATKATGRRLRNDADLITAKGQA